MGFWQGTGVRLRAVEPEDAEHFCRRNEDSERVRDLDLLFDELRYQKVTVPVPGDNEPSIRLHEKPGFTHEGALRRMVHTHGRYVGEIWFGKTAE